MCYKRHSWRAEALCREGIWLIGKAARREGEPDEENQWERRLAHIEVLKDIWRGLSLMVVLT
jgi:hypothetical protein